MNHPNLSEDINRRITESELFGGIWASEPTGVNGIGENVMPVGAVVEVETLHNVYRIEKRAHGGFFIDGHPQFCPYPAPYKPQPLTTINRDQGRKRRNGNEFVEKNHRNNFDDADGLQSAGVVCDGYQQRCNSHS